jgi:hypothetical protein
LGYRSENGRFIPGVSVFKRDGATILRVADTAFRSGDDFCARSGTWWICRRSEPKAGGEIQVLAIRIAPVLGIRRVPRLLSIATPVPASLVALGGPITGATTRRRDPSALAGEGAEAPGTLRELVASPNTHPDRATAADPTSNAEGRIARRGMLNHTVHNRDGSAVATFAIASLGHDRHAPNSVEARARGSDRDHADNSTGTEEKAKRRARDSLFCGSHGNTPADIRERLMTNKLELL